MSRPFGIELAYTLQDTATFTKIVTIAVGIVVDDIPPSHGEVSLVVDGLNVEVHSCKEE